MTFRAILIGFFGTAFICGFSYFNNYIIQQTFLVGNNMPITVYGALLILVIMINPLLYRYMKKHSFSAKEIVVMMTITLAACVVPGAGLMRCFTCAMVLPHQYNKTEPGWKEQGVVDMVPKKMLVDVSKNENDVLNGFIQGMSVGNKHIPITKVPWYAWTRMLLFWLPIVLTLWIALIGLSMVIHKHWSNHELLPYPVALFTNALLPDKDNRQSSIFGNPLFWLGAGFVFFIHFNISIGLY